MFNSKPIRASLGALLVVTLAACQNGRDGTVTADDAKPFDGITAGETIYFSGNEPFWGGEIIGERLRYTTPENMDGVTIAVKRFAGMNGLGYGGTLDGAPFDMLVTPGECDDTMADRTYPYTVTLQIGEEVRNGCGWTDTHPYRDEGAL